MSGPGSGRARRGISLMLVMVAVGMSLVLTYAFLRTQMTVAQISRNGITSDLARQAARTGAAVAVGQMQASDWQGVDVPLSGAVHSDDESAARYVVEFRPLDGANETPGDAGLHVVVRSTGIRESFERPGERIERQVEVLVRLQPRLPGRTVSAADSAAAADVAANPGDYDTIQTHALFAGASGNSLSLGPATRIEGPLWLRHHLDVLAGPAWGSSVRRDLLKSVGSRFASSGARQHPHPLSETITFHNNLIPALRTDLDDLRTPWQRMEPRLVHPVVDFAAWRSYRLYAGGFEYEAAEVGPTLRNVTLRPTPENPLGIFFRSGDLRIEDHVTVQGTLVVTGRITVRGEFVHLAGFNWSDEQGRPLVGQIDQWPRLPVIVARDVEFHRDARAVVEGAVVAQMSVRATAGDFERSLADAVSISGTATARPLQQPWSLVQFSGLALLETLNDRGDYALWLDDGSKGRWFPIVGVDAANRRLTVVGEVRRDGPTPCRIERNRLRHVDLVGPVSGESHQFISPPAWSGLSAVQWDERHQTWRQTNFLREQLGLPAVEFVDWLADPVNFAGWLPPYSIYGLTIEPTVHLRHPGAVHYRWSPPLFEPYRGSDPDDPHAGYRWKVLSWRDLP